MGKVIRLDYKRGKLIVCSKSNYYKIPADQYFYLESYKYDFVEGAQYIGELAPSLELQQYIKKAKEKSYAAKDLYFEKSYAAKIKNGTEKRIIQRLRRYLENGQTLVFFCEEEDMRYNHVRILGERFKGLGYTVQNRLEHRSDGFCKRYS